MRAYLTRSRDINPPKTRGISASGRSHNVCGVFPAQDQPVLTTVVIAAWGGYVGDRLLEAVESITAQDRRSRLIVIDNASDVTVRATADAEILRSDRRLTVGGARNLGLEQVRTPYVLFWDADDVMLPGTLGVLEDALSQDPRLVAFGTAIVEAPTGERHRWPRRWVAAAARLPTTFAVLNSIWSLYPTTGATIMRASAAKAAGGYAAIESGEDWVLGASLAFRGTLGWSERPGRVYRIHEGSVLARHGTVGHLRRSAAAVRQRLRDDPGIPRRVAAALPLIVVGQQLAIGTHLVVRMLRRLRRAPKTPIQ